MKRHQNCCRLDLDQPACQLLYARHDTSIWTRSLWPTPSQDSKAPSSAKFASPLPLAAPWSLRRHYPANAHSARMSQEWLAPRLQQTWRRNGAWLTWTCYWAWTGGARHSSLWHQTKPLKQPCLWGTGMTRGSYETYGDPHKPLRTLGASNSSDRFFWKILKQYFKRQAVHQKPPKAFKEHPSLCWSMPTLPSL